MVPPCCDNVPEKFNGIVLSLGIDVQKKMHKHAVLGDVLALWLLLVVLGWSALSIAYCLYMPPY